MNQSYRDVVLIEVDKLRHIEGFGKKRIIWLKNKILKEGIWTNPLKISNEHSLVMDGNHRMEAAQMLNFIERSLSDCIYPYKTAKHAFPDSNNTLCRYILDELR